MSNEEISLSRPKALNGEIKLSPDEEYFFYATFLSALSVGSSELLHFKNSPNINTILNWFHALGIQTQLEPETLVISGMGPSWRPNFQDIVFELSRHLRVNALFVEFLKLSQWPIVKVTGSSLHLSELSETLLGIKGYEVTASENKIDIQFSPETELRSEYKLPQGNSLKRDLIFLKALLENQSCIIQEPFALNDSFLQLMQSFGAISNIDRQGTQELSELEKRLARLRGIKTEKKSLCSFGGYKSLKAKQIRLPADPDVASALAVLGCLIPKSYFILKNVSVNPSRSSIFTSLKRLGYKVELLRRKERQGDAIADIEVQFTRDRLARKIGGESLLSSLQQYPLLSVAACYAEGETILRDIPLALDFQTNRLHCLAYNLKHTGAEIGEFDEGIIIRGREECDSNTYDGKNDEVLALALYILSRTTHGTSKYKNLDLLNLHFPEIVSIIEELEATQPSED